jgi:hypothetical protein
MNIWYRFLVWRKERQWIREVRNAENTRREWGRLLQEIHKKS